MKKVQNINNKVNNPDNPYDFYDYEEFCRFVAYEQELLAADDIDQEDYDDTMRDLSTNYPEYMNKHLSEEED